MIRRLALPSLAVALALAGAPSAHGATTADRVATRSAVATTLRFAEEHRTAGRRAGGRASAIRRRARECVDAFRRVPVGESESAYGFYFLSLSSGLWSVDQPIFTRWIVQGLAPAARRSRLWRRERDRLLAQLARARTGYALGRPDVCPVIRAWQATGFAPDRAPEPIAQIKRMIPVWDREAPSWPSEAVRRLLMQTSGRRTGSAVFAWLDHGVDEPDDRVVRHDDPIVQLFDGIG